MFDRYPFPCKGFDNEARAKGGGFDESPGTRTSVSPNSIWQVEVPMIINIVPGWVTPAPMVAEWASMIPARVFPCYANRWQSKSILLAISASDRTIDRHAYNPGERSPGQTLENTASELASTSCQLTIFIV